MVISPSIPQISEEAARVQTPEIWRCPDVVIFVKVGSVWILGRPASLPSVSARGSHPDAKTEAVRRILKQAIERNSTKLHTQEYSNEKERRIEIAS